MLLTVVVRATEWGQAPAPQQRVHTTSCARRGESLQGGADEDRELLGCGTPGHFLLPVKVTCQSLGTLSSRT